MKKISVIIPMYYEEEVVQECYNKMTQVLSNIKDYEYEIICVNDGSKDKTLSILEKIAENDKKVKVISFSRNFGHQCAVTAGLKYVTGDAVVIIDADLQDPPELIPDMLKLWEDGNEVIYGKRKTREGESKFKLLTAKMFYNTLNALSDVEIPKDTGDFRLVDRKVVDVVNSLPEHNKFLRGLFSWVGFEQKAFEYERKERFAGKTKYPRNFLLLPDSFDLPGLFLNEVHGTWNQSLTMSGLCFRHLQREFHICPKEESTVFAVILSWILHYKSEQ